MQARTIRPWKILAILSAAVCGALPVLPGVQPQTTQADPPPKGSQHVIVTVPTDHSKPVTTRPYPDGTTPPDGGAAKPDDTTSGKGDPTDIRNTIGDLSLKRGLDELKAPKPKGLWEQLVDQPYFTPPVKARKLLFFGQYADAEARYTALLKADPNNQDYIEGILDAMLQQGHAADIQRFTDKVASLTDAQRNTAKVTRLRAQVLLSQGKTDEARDLLKHFIDAHPKLTADDPELLAVYNTYGNALEIAAEYPAAVGIYDQVQAVGEGGLPEDPYAATQISLATYRKSVLSGNEHGDNKYNAVLSQLAAIEETDQTYWPAKLVQAQLLLASHNDKDTGALIGEIISLNPNVLQCKFLSIDHAIANYDFDAAKAQLDELRTQTDDALADAYEGRLLLKERLPQQALAPLQSAIKKDPQLAQARGWLAGAYYLLMDPKKMDEQLAAIKTPGGQHPVALFEAGEILRDARQFVEAEKLYDEAKDAAKWWSEPPAALAQLYLETGDEKKAKIAYDESFAIDPYNRRAFNQMKLLDILGKFSVLESKSRLRPGSDEPAFIIKYDPQDEVLAKLAMEWMEKVRPEIWSYFQVTDLPEPTTIEFFPTHEQFGVRTTGLPWIGTVGACTGPVIAMDVPRGGAKDMMGAFDWARVLRHEYTHTVTLAMTNNRVPHWLTEAAACEQEEAPRDWSDCQFLDLQYRTGELFTIANLNWGFIKPKRSVDRQLAYRESQWLYEYLVAHYGLPKMLDFLHAFHDGLTEEKAWEKVYGKTMPEMDKEWQAWAATQLESWGLPTDMLPKRADLEAAVKKNPKDIDSMVKLAFVMAGSGDKKARATAEQALAIDDKNIGARELLGAILAQSKDAKDQDRAQTLLEGVLKDNPKRPVSIRTLAVLSMQHAMAQKDPAKRDADLAVAEKWFLNLQAVRPLDESSYTNLAGIYLVKQENSQAIAQLLELERHEQHDERIPRTLAELYQKEGQLPDAQDSAFRAIRINPYNAVNHELLAQILMAEKEPRKAIEYWTDATTLQPKVGEFWEGLAEAKGLTNDLEGASEAAKKAVALDPKTSAAKWMKE